MQIQPQSQATFIRESQSCLTGALWKIADIAVI